MFNFTDQVVLVTGGGGNLGQAVARAFEMAGASLIVTDRSTDRLPTLYPTLANDSKHYLASGIDITKSEDAQKLVNAALDRFGRIDVLANTVGGYQAGTPLHETSYETWDLMMTLNARSIFTICRAVIPTMLAAHKGKIVSVASGSALRASGNDSAYSASKSALARITESMAAEYKHAGLRVNAVLPGTLDTPPNRAAMPDVDQKDWIKLDDLAQIIVFLASDAAIAINGALIPVNGSQ